MKTARTRFPMFLAFPLMLVTGCSIQDQSKKASGDIKKLDVVDHSRQFQDWHRLAKARIREGTTEARWLAILEAVYSITNGDAADAFETIQRFDTDREILIHQIGQKLGEMDAQSEIRTFLLLLDEPSDQNEFLEGVTESLVSHNWVSQASNCAALIPDDARRDRVFSSIAKRQAMLGRYDEADATIAKLVNVGTQKRDELKEYVAGQRARTTDKAETPINDRTELARYSVLIFDMPFSSQSFASAEVDHAKPETRAYLWRMRAKDQREKGERQESLKSLQKAIAAAQEIQSAASKARNYASIADLQNQAGARAGAIETIELWKQAYEAEVAEEDPMKTEREFSLRLVGLLLLRLGEFNEALKLAERSTTLATWLGESCVSDDRLAELRARVETVQSKETQIYLSLGVLHGLIVDQPLRRP